MREEARAFVRFVPSEWVPVLRVLIVYWEAGFAVAGPMIGAVRVQPYRTNNELRYERSACKCTVCV